MRDSVAVSMVVVAMAACGDLVINDPQSACAVADRGKWRTSGLGESEVAAPFCPVTVSWNAFPKQYTINVWANDMSKLNSIPRAIVSFFDLNGAPVLPDAFHKDQIRGFNGNVSQLMGTYNAAQAVGPTTGIDFARVRVPLATFIGVNPDTARAEAFLAYKFHAQAKVIGPDVGSNTEAVNVTADASAEFRPITYEWWIDGVHQGSPSNQSTIDHLFSAVGSHAVRVVVRANDGHVYDLTKYIEITPCPNGEIIC